MQLEGKVVGKGSKWVVERERDDGEGVMEGSNFRQRECGAVMLDCYYIKLTIIINLTIIITLIIVVVDIIMIIIIIIKERKEERGKRTGVWKWGWTG